MNRSMALAFLLGVWCGATVFMWLVATQNFQVVDRILEAKTPGFAATTAALSPEDLRLALRYQASEVNRLFFHGWGTLQPVIAVVVMLVAWRSGGGRLVIGATAAMLLITVVLQLYVVPETIRLGRILDFLPRDPPPPQAAPFWRLHHTYTGLDMLKFLLGLGAAFLLVRGKNAGPDTDSQDKRRLLVPSPECGGATCPTDCCGHVADLIRSRANRNGVS